MAADSGYHSFSLPRVLHNDDSSETSESSNSFDLQESADAFTSNEAQTVFDVCIPERLTTIPKPPSNPEPAIPLITSTTANKGKGFTKINCSRKANAINRVNASPKTSFLIKGNVLKRSRRTTRFQKAALPKPQPITLNIFRDDDSGHDFESLFGPAGLEAALTQHFKIAVNMTEHMNFALFHPEAKDGINESVMEEFKEMAEETIYFFDGLQGGLKSQIEEIECIHSYLPTLDDNVEEHHLGAAIKIWAERICEYVVNILRPIGNPVADLQLRKVRKPRTSEQQLLNRFAGVYDANVYSPFLQLRRRNARHNICELSVHLDSIYNAIEGAIELHEQIIWEMSGFRQALEGAFDDFRRSPHAWYHWWGHQRIKATAQGHISEAMTPSVPGTPITSRYAESDGKARFSAVTSLRTTALESLARAADMKRENT